jgi:transposase InsO family protein
MDLPYNWDFIQSNIPSEKLAELRRRFMEEWRSGRYTKREMMERYNDVVETFDSTREEHKGRFDNFVEDMRATEPGNCFCIDTGACFIGDKTQIQFPPVFDEFNSELVVLVAGMSCDYTLSLKALEELCRLYQDRELAIGSDGGKEFDNHEVKDFFVKKGISWIKISNPWNNPYAERGIRTIKHEYVNQVWIGNFSEFEKHQRK